MIERRSSHPYQNRLWYSEELDWQALETIMTDALTATRNELQAAAENAGSDVQNNVHSIDEGLMEMTEGDKANAESGPKPDRLADLIDKLDGLIVETDGETREHLKNARESLGTYQKQSDT